jgi:hypothetical protein
MSLRIVAAFGLTVGRPDPDEHAGIKPRLPQAAVLHRERYDAASADGLISTYDKRLSEYNARHGLSGNWSERVLGVQITGEFNSSTLAAGIICDDAGGRF